MKKIMISILVSLFILSGINSIAVPEADDINYIKETISFSQPTLSQIGHNTHVKVDSIETQLIEPGKPVLPTYERTYTFPFGTTIKDINCVYHDSQFISINENLEYTPMPTINGQQSKTESLSVKAESAVYPDTWFDYDECPSDSGS